MPVKQGSGPDFVVLGQSRDGQFELGAAWAKTSKKDKPYLSVKLDGPTLVQPINCALTKQADGSHALVWKPGTPTKRGRSSRRVEQGGPAGRKAGGVSQYPPAVFHRGAKRRP